jgi:hypothetical protein
MILQSAKFQIRNTTSNRAPKYPHIKSPAYYHVPTQASDTLQLACVTIKRSLPLHVGSGYTVLDQQTETEPGGGFCTQPPQISTNGDNTLVAPFGACRGFGF